jgi:ketosteroid isomerase-like protein
MRKSGLLLITYLSLAATASGERQPATAATPASILDELVSLERAALDLWIRRDPKGYLDLYAPEVTYFDPFNEARLDGVEAMRAMVAGLATTPNPVTDPRYELIGAKAQQYGEVAILTFRLISYGTLQGRPESVLARWNSTETYRRIAGRWKIVHSHWSFTRPDLKPPA